MYKIHTAYFCWTTGIVGFNTVSVVNACPHVSGFCFHVRAHMRKTFDRSMNFGICLNVVICLNIVLMAR
jgi:hypothetical protein